jgi:hypothetical protein
MLIHVGKAGGSSLRTLFSISRDLCQQSVNGSEKQACALAKVTRPSELIHLNRNHKEAKHYNKFLVPVRNPVDRMISWFYYERENVRDPTKKRQSKRMEQLDKCYPNVTALFSHGLVPAESINNQTTCQRLARSCITGELPCYAHNFFNYEVYLEDLLLWKGAASSETPSSKKDASTFEQVNASSTWREIRIDVVRIGHTTNDLSRTLEFWTGERSTYVEDFYEIRNDNTKSKKHQDVTLQAAQSLCRTICRELIVYKKILAYADNLNQTEIEESFRQLDDRCGFDVNAECGSTFFYRNVKREKFDRICNPKVALSSSRRSLFEISGNHPSC